MYEIMRQYQSTNPTKFSEKFAEILKFPPQSTQKFWQKEEESHRMSTSEVTPTENRQGSVAEKFLDKTIHEKPSQNDEPVDAGLNFNNFFNEIRPHKTDRRTKNSLPFLK